MCCCCPSAKFRSPEFGNDNYEKAATILTVILFLLVIPELIAYATFTDVYVKGDADMCCGMITEKSIDIVQAPCKETDFPDSTPKIGICFSFNFYVLSRKYYYSIMSLYYISRKGGN